MDNKIANYVADLISKNKDSRDLNISIFTDFIHSIYKGKDVAVFMFPFLEKIDKFIVKPENIDIIEDMFRTIKKEYKEFDIVVSGSFGKWLYKLIDDKKIKFDGNVVLMNGGLQSGRDNNEVELIKKRYSGIKNKKFIFVDDSYFTGQTLNKIKKFFKDKLESTIDKAFVFYTHKKSPSDVYSMYCYSDNYNSKIIHKTYKYFDYIKNLNLKDKSSSIKKDIENGKIKNPDDLISVIKKLYKIEERFITKYTEWIN